MGQREVRRHLVQEIVCVKTFPKIDSDSMNKSQLNIIGLVKNVLQEQIFLEKDRSTSYTCKWCQPVLGSIFITNIVLLNFEKTF